MLWLCTNCSLQTDDPLSHISSHFDLVSTHCCILPLSPLASSIALSAAVNQTLLSVSAMSVTATANPGFVPQSPSHWVPDDKRSSCTSCHKEFTFFNRRHQSAF